MDHVTALFTQIALTVTELRESVHTRRVVAFTLSVERARPLTWRNLTIALPSMLDRSNDPADPAGYLAITIQPHLTGHPTASLSWRVRTTSQDTLIELATYGIYASMDDNKEYREITFPLINLHKDRALGVVDTILAVLNEAIRGTSITNPAPNVPPYESLCWYGNTVQFANALVNTMAIACARLDLGVTFTGHTIDPDQPHVTFTVDVNGEPYTIPITIQPAHT